MSQVKRHIPTRTCVICREKRQKNELLRIVKSPEGEIVFDVTGRMDGRGAYVCGDATHWGENSPSEGSSRGKLGNALKTKIDESRMKLLSDAIQLHITE